jgi:hypothetical protein
VDITRNISTYHTPKKTLSQLEKYKFSGEKKNHWPGQCNPFGKIIKNFDAF